MLTDLANFDLIDLVLADTWPLKKQSDLIIEFQEILGSYLEKELEKYFDEKSNEELRTLLKDSTVTPEKLKEFYEAKIPNTNQTFEDIVLQFKKKFILKVYENKIKELQEKNDTTQQADLTNWQTVLQSAQQDDWNSVNQTLQTITH